MIVAVSSDVRIPETFPEIEAVFQQSPGSVAPGGFILHSQFHIGADFGTGMIVRQNLFAVRAGIAREFALHILKHIKAYFSACPVSVVQIQVAAFQIVQSETHRKTSVLVLHSGLPEHPATPGTIAYSEGIDSHLDIVVQLAAVYGQTDFGT